MVFCYSVPLASLSRFKSLRINTQCPCPPPGTETYLITAALAALSCFCQYMSLFHHKVYCSRQVKNDLYYIATILNASYFLLHYSRGGVWPSMIRIHGACGRACNAMNLTMIGCMVIEPNRPSHLSGTSKNFVSMEAPTVRNTVTRLSFSLSKT
ncbi:hypothetical protein EDD18DRAFT_288352 [Armillaria luteobubalina]|uniref:Uncharacterized protein n=1 Tax=Armillaria luteobubalina TaxID=153913 RepID=A0AA39Q2H6_9AGAR|nr:hypothetical protein EDD18DRAFT_288352 [Armillaria luteobubalina]